MKRKFLAPVMSQSQDTWNQAFVGFNSDMDQKKPDQTVGAEKEWPNNSSHKPPLLDNKHEACAQIEECNDSATGDKNLSNVVDEKEQPRLGRKRSSSLSSLLQLKQILGEEIGDQSGKITLRRVSSIPLTNSRAMETQLEDGLLTTTLCSTEL